MPRLKPNVNRDIKTIKSYIGKALVFCEGTTEYNYLEYFTKIFKVNEKSKYTNIDIEVEVQNVHVVKRPVNCLEYVVVHEIVHLIEKEHNDKFKSL